MTRGEYRPETMQFKPDGEVPNSRFPVLLYRGAVAAEPGADLTDAVEATFRRHDWLNNWRELGVYDYPHFHTPTPRPTRVLGMARGRIELRLGGRGGAVVTLTAGDVLVLPAGTSHTRLGHSADSWMARSALSRRPGLGPDPRRRVDRGRGPARRQAHRQPADPVPRPRHRRPNDRLARGPAHLRHPLLIIRARRGEGRTARSIASAPSACRLWPRPASRIERQSVIAPATSAA